MKNKLMILGIFCILAVVGCNKNSSTSTFTPDCSGAAKSFTTDVLPIMQSNCVSCHNGFASYNGVNGSKSSIRSQIIGGSMPKNGSLSADQKNKIVCWIDNGAPNN